MRRIAIIITMTLALLALSVAPALASVVNMHG